MKKCIYTAIIGNYDNLSQPLHVNEDYDYIVFTNKPAHSDFWKVVVVKNPEGLSPVKLARKIKIRPDIYLPEYNFSIWTDGNIVQKGDLNKAFPKLDVESTMYVMKHPFRRCIYDEARACKKVKKTRNKKERDILNKQMLGYYEDGYPKNAGLIASGILARYHNNPEILKLMELWWKEVKFKCHRDQVSFNYCLSKTLVKLECLPFSIMQTKCKGSGSYFVRRGHKLWR